MSRMSVAQMIAIVEQIEAGRSDRLNRESRFEPLWQHPFLRESFMRFLESCAARDPVTSHDRRNFEVVCELMAPQFITILDQLELPSLATLLETKRVDRPTATVL